MKSLLMIMNLRFQNRGYKMTYWFNKELKNIISETYDRTHDSIYPCSMNFQLWHSGIHIDTNNSCIKNIISKGEIIASYINTDYINDTQSDSFILVKHCIKFNKDEKFFYVLYSNLQPLKAYKFQKKANNEVVDEILDDTSTFVSGELVNVNDVQ